MEEALHFSSILEASNNKLWGSHFGIPPVIAETLLANGDSRRVVCRINDKVEYQCAMLPRGDGSFLITVNKGIRTRLKLDTGAKIEVSLKPDESEYGLPMPEELAELLAQDETGHRLLHALTPGKLRTLLYIVAQPKDTERRLERALCVVEHLKANAGKINYKQLNQSLRERV